MEKVPAKAGEIRGVWVCPGQLDDYGIEKGLNEMKKMGLTDNFLLVKGITGKVCWPSTLAYDFYENKTLLERAVEYSKKNEIRIHAWFVCSQDIAYLEENPDSRMYGVPNALGGGFQRASEMVDFAFDSAYRKYIISLINEVISCSVDGIHLDYIGYPTGAWGWGPYQIGRAWMDGVDVDLLLKTAIETWGKAGDGRKFISMYQEFRYPDINRWVQMRMNDVRSFVEEIRDSIKKVKPEIVFSAALMPEGGDSDPKVMVSAMVHYGQRYVDFGELCNIIVPMTYHVDFGKEASWLIDVFKGAKEVTKNKTKILMGIQGWDISPEEMQKAIYMARTADIDGISVFQFKSIWGNKALKEALAEALK